MYTFEVKVNHVNGNLFPVTLHIDAYDKVECADKVRERFDFPQSISYSMHEMDRPLTESEKQMQAIDISFARRYANMREIRNYLNS